MTTFTLRLIKVGDSHAVIIPKWWLERKGLKRGDPITVELK